MRWELDMNDCDELLERAARLKHRLVSFAQQTPRVARHLDKDLSERFRGSSLADDTDVINAIDHFILRHRLPDGRSVIEHFVGSNRELADTDRQLVLGWSDVVDGIFQIKTNDGNGIDAVNLIDELTYRIRANAGPAVLARFQPGDFLVGRVVPLGDVWMLSGAQSGFPAADKPDLLRAAAQAAMTHPELVLRNPAKLARAWELQREDRDCFIDFFGTDLVVFPGDCVLDQWHSYWRTRTTQLPIGPQAAAGDRLGSPSFSARFDLPDEIAAADSVAIIYDEAEGLTFLVNFGAVEAAFDNPALARVPVYRQAVMSYLRDDTITALPFRRLAARDANRASLLFARMLNRPAFVWARDGEALLRRYKADSMSRDPQPSITVLSDELAQVLHVA
jgi:hypothetical protein